MSFTDLAVLYAAYFLAVAFIVLLCALISDWRYERRQRSWRDSRRINESARQEIDELALRRRAR